MAYKPTRQAQTRLSVPNTPGVAGMLNQAKASEQVARTLGSISQNLMSQTYEAEENADVANAILEASKIVKPDGTINPDMADAASKVWSSKGMNTYMRSINQTMATWSDGQLNFLKDQYILQDPTGTNTDARSAYDEAVEQLRSSLDAYPVAQSNFDLIKSIKDSELELSFAGEKQKRELTVEVNSAATAAVSVINEVERVGRNLGDSGVDNILALHESLEGPLTTIATSPLQSEGRGRQVRTLDAQFQTSAVAGVLINRAVKKAEASVSRNSRDDYGVSEAFERIAWDVENMPGYVEGVFGDKLPVPLADRVKIAQLIRKEAETYISRRKSYATAIDNQIAERVNEWSLNNIEMAESLDSLPSNQAIADFVSPLGAKAPYAVMSELTAKRNRKRNSLVSRSNTQHTADTRDMLNELQPAIDTLRLGGTAEQEAQALAILAQAESRLGSMPGIRSKIATAKDAAFDRGVQDIAGMLLLIEAQIEENGYGDERNAGLFDQGSRLLEQFPAGEGESAIARWKVFTSNHADMQILGLVDEDIENIRNNKPLAHTDEWANLDGLRSVVSKLDPGRLDSLTSAIATRETAQLADDLSDARRLFETRFNPNKPNIDVTPAEGQKMIEQIEKKYRDSDPSQVNVLVSGLQSVLTRYATEHKKLVDNQAFLAAVEEETFQTGAHSASRTKVEKLVSLGNIDLDNPVYISNLKDFHLRYGFIHSDFLAYVDGSVMQSAEQADRVLSIFNDLIVHRANNTPGLSKKMAREQAYVQLSDNSVAGRENASRTSGMLRLLFAGADFESAKSTMLKGTTTSFNSAMRGAGIDYDADLAERDKDYLFNYLVDQTVSIGEEGLWELFSETINFKEETVGEQSMEEWWQSQNDQGKTWITQQFEANPNIKYYLTSQFKYHVVEAAQSGNLSRADLSGAIIKTWLSIKGRVGVQMEKVGEVGFIDVARESSLLPFTDPIGLMAAGIDETAQFIGVELPGGYGDPTLYAPRLTFRPITPWMNSYGGVPAPLHSITDDILKYDVAGAVNAAPDEYFVRRNTTRAEVMDAIRNDYVYFRTEPLMGTEAGNPMWSVHVKVGGSGTKLPLTLFEEYQPKWDRINLSGVYDKGVRDGVNIQFADVEFGKIYSYNKIFGEVAIRQAIMNEIQETPNLSRGRTIINAFNTLAGTVGYPPIEMSDENIDNYENFFDLFAIDM